ncbi:MAG: peptidyl-prolyl cis-trans isomerase [candidate division WOR-3 bacterium]
MFMQKLRSNVGKVILWFMAFAFVAWIGFDLGADLVGTRLRKPWERGIIAEVEGKEIPYELYRSRLEKAISDTLKARGAESIPREDEEAIAEAIWQEMLDDIRWERVLKDRGLELEDETVLRILAQFPPKEITEDSTFWFEGRFSYDRYLAALGNPQNLPYFREYELQLRKDIPRHFMGLDLMTSVSLSEREVFYDYRLKNTKTHLIYIAVNAGAAIPNEEVPVSDDEITQYYNDHKEDYKVGERATLFVVRIPKAPSSQDTAAAREQLLTALEEIRQGTPFEEAVKYYTEDPKGKETGGDMGWVKPEFAPAEIREALAGKAPGALVGPVQSPIGWHLFRVDSVQGDSMRLRQILTRIQISPETEEALAEEMRGFLDRAKEIGFSEAAAELGLRVDTAMAFELEKGFIPVVGLDPVLMQELRKAKPGYTSALIRKPGFYAAVHVAERFPKGYYSLEEIREKVRADLIVQKKKEKATEIVKKALDEIAAGRTPSLPPGFILQEDTAATYNTYQPGIADKDIFWGAVSGTKPGERRGPFEGKMSVYGLMVISKTEPSWEDFQAQSAMLRRQAEMTYFQRLMGGWQEELTRDLNVKDYRPYIFLY